MTKRSIILRTVASVAALASVATASSAQAAPLKFTFTGGYNGTFLIDSSPVPNSFSSGNFFLATYASGTGDFDGIGNTQSPNIAITTASYIASGGVSLQFYDPLGNLAGTFGPSVMTGDVSSPTIVRGTYSMSDADHNPVALSITAAPGAPAPDLGATWAAALAAAFALAFTRRRQPAAT